MIRPQDDPRGLYTRAMREAHAEQFIMWMASLGPDKFERTQSKHIARTYGVPVELVKHLKADQRAELGGGGGK